jgi:hypothetical protein
MVELPEPLSHTVEAVYQAYEARNADRTGDNTGVAMSQAASECDLQIWYAFRWAAPAEKIDGIKQSRFDTGNAWESRLLDDLELIGCQVERIDPATGKQFRVELANGWLRGKMDGRVLGLPEAPKTLHVVECKSHNSKSFKDLQKKKLAASKPDHFIQCQDYMLAQGLTRCLYYAVCKDTDERYAERVEFDAGVALAHEARIARIVSSDRAPARLFEDPSSKAAFACGWCPAKSQCHERAFARQNCRTCLSASFEDGARVRCTHWQKELSYEEQQAGCAAHLYLPDLIPGEQIDASEEGRTVTVDRDADRPFHLSQPNRVQARCLRRRWPSQNSRAQPGDVRSSAHSTEFALRKGRSALFLDTGLGKSLCALDWGRVIVERNEQARLDAGAAGRRAAARARSREIWHRRRRLSVGEEIGAKRIYITNYDRLDKFDPPFRGVISGRVQRHQELYRQDDTRTDRHIRKTRLPALLHGHAGAERSHRTWHAFRVSGRDAARRNAADLVHQRHDGHRDMAHQGACAREFWSLGGELVAVRFAPVRYWLFDDDGFVLPPITDHHHEVTADRTINPGEETKAKFIGQHRLFRIPDTSATSIHTREAADDRRTAPILVAECID